MNEQEFGEKLIPSLLRAAEKLEKTKGVELSSDTLGNPGLLARIGNDEYIISCSLIGDGGEAFIYRVEKEGYEAWEFPDTVLPHELKAFPFLIDIFEEIRGDGIDKLDFDGTDLENWMGNAVDMAYFGQEETRLPGLSQALSKLGRESIYSFMEDGRSCLSVTDGEGEILFSYMAILPEEDICLLRVDYKGKQILLPEMSGLRDAGTYEKILKNLDKVGREPLGSE